MIDPSFTVTATITVGKRPAGMVFLGRYLYVALSEDHAVAVVDTETNTVHRTVSVGRSPVRMAVVDFGDTIDVPDTPAAGGVPDQTIYVANADDGTISVIRPMLFDTVEHVIAAPAYDIAVSHRGKNLYLTDPQANSVHVLDTTTKTIVESIRVGQTPTRVVASPDGTRAYVSNFADATVSVIDTTTATPTVTSIAVGKPFWGMVLSTDGRHLYGAQFEDLFTPKVGHLAVIDTSTATVTTVACGLMPGFVALNTAGTRAFVCNAADDTVSTVDITTTPPRVVSNVFVPSPGEIVQSPDGKHVYVADHSGTTVSVIGRLNTADLDDHGG